MLALLCHLVGDYLLQSDWMASKKTTSWWPAFCHAVMYTLPFLFLTRSWKALLFIAGTHFVIDHWRLARYVCWAKNWLAPRWIEETRPTLKNESLLYEKTGRWLRNESWTLCSNTGYGPDKPAWLAVWLLIITDNTMHLICNEIALRWMP